MDIKKIFFTLLTVPFLVGQETNQDETVNERELMEKAIEIEASSSNAAADRQSYIDIDNQIIILIGDIQFLSQQLDLAIYTDNSRINRISRS